MNLDILLSFIIICIGVYGLGTSKGIIKSLVCLNVIQASIILLYLGFANIPYGVPPILPGNTNIMVDPLPQALMITAIVIDAAVTSLALMLSIKIYQYYGTLEWSKLTVKEK